MPPAVAPNMVQDMSDLTAQAGSPDVIVVMGVSGSGKSTVAKGIATAMGWDFAEGDEFHPKANVEKMAKGIPLTDEDRFRSAVAPVSAALAA